MCAGVLVFVLWLAGCCLTVSCWHARAHTHKRRKPRRSPALYILHALPRYLSPTCLAMSSWVEREFSQVWDCSRLFYQQPVPYFHMKYYSRQEILPREQGNNWVGINDLQVHICNNTNTGRGEPRAGSDDFIDAASDNTSIINYVWIWQETQDNVQVRVHCLQASWDRQSGTKKSHEKLFFFFLKATCFQSSINYF